MSEHGRANPVSTEAAPPPAGQAMGRRDREGPALPPAGQAMGGRDREGPALPTSGQAMGRRDREGPALALRNWRVPWRVIALIAIPAAVAVVFAGLPGAAAAGSAGP